LDLKNTRWSRWRDWDLLHLPNRVHQDGHAAWQGLQRSRYNWLCKGDISHARVFRFLSRLLGPTHLLNAQKRRQIWCFRIRCNEYVHWKK